MRYESTMYWSSFETKLRLKSMESSCIAFCLNRTQTITHQAAFSLNQVITKCAIDQGIVRSVAPQCIHRKASFDLHPVLHFDDGEKAGQLTVLPCPKEHMLRQ